MRHESIAELAQGAEITSIIPKNKATPPKIVEKMVLRSDQSAKHVPAISEQSTGRARQVAKSPTSTPIKVVRKSLLQPPTTESKRVLRSADKNIAVSSFIDPNAAQKEQR